MIRVSFCPEDYAVRITGHAGSGPKGRDLLCAAVSALALTLERNVAQMDRLGWLTEQQVSLEPGNALIRCRPRKDCAGAVKLIFAGIWAGFTLLAEKWPEFLWAELRDFPPAQGGSPGWENPSGTGMLCLSGPAAREIAADFTGGT